MKTNKRPGRVLKDAEIKNGFNQSKIYETDPDTERLLLLEKRRLYRQAYRKAKKAGENIPKSTQLLDDMRWVYRQVGGRRRLEKFIKENPKAFELMVKELMKLESQIKQGELKKGDTTGDEPQSVLVVLKGLGDERRYPVNSGGEGPAIDMRPVLSPDGSNYEESKKEDE
jgi:hypothetical protein